MDRETEQPCLLIDDTSTVLVTVPGAFLTARFKYRHAHAFRSVRLREWYGPNGELDVAPRMIKLHSANIYIHLRHLEAWGTST